MKPRIFALTFFIALLVGGCTFFRGSSDWCEVEDDSQYTEFEPSKSLASELTGAADVYFKSYIGGSGQNIVWKKKSESKVAACIPNEGRDDPACGSWVYYFREGNAGWEQEYSENILCHRVKP